MEKAEEWFNYGIELAKEFGPKLLTAILIYLIGTWIIKKIVGAARKMMAKSKYDESLQRFLLNLFSWYVREEGGENRAASKGENRAASQAANEDAKETGVGKLKLSNDIKVNYLLPLYIILVILILYERNSN